MRPVRHLAFFVVALLACLALPLAIVSTWTANVVTDSDGYVEAVGPLADDSTVQEAVEERLEAEVLARLPRLPPQTVRRAVVRVVEGPEFRPAWEDANRSAHEQLVTALEASEDSPVGERRHRHHRPRHPAGRGDRGPRHPGPGGHLQRPGHPDRVRPGVGPAARAGPHDVPARAPGRPLDAGGLAAADRRRAAGRRQPPAGRWPGWRLGSLVCAGGTAARGVAGPPGGDRPRGHRARATWSARSGTWSPPGCATAPGWRSPPPWWCCCWR